MQISHHILGLLVIKYIDLKKNNLFHFYLHFGNRFLTIVTNVLCKSDENRSSYFGLIGEKICWSEKEQPVLVSCEAAILEGG